MLPGRFSVRVVSAAACFICVATLAAAAQSADAQPAPGEAPLTPCLAVHADGSPVGALEAFPSTKQMTVVFRLKPDESGQVLKSQWVAVGDDVAAQQPIAENTLELRGSKSGWLRLTLKEPVPPGRYQLVTFLDDKPWQSTDIQIIAPLTDVKADKPADLIAMKDDAEMRYDMVIMPAPGTKSQVPGVSPGPDGSTRATLAMSYGKTDDAGTPVKLSINGQTLGEMWVKLDESGLRAVRMKEGEAIADASHMIYPLPPVLQDGMEWTTKGKEGGEEKLQLFGPVPIDYDSRPAAGFIIFSSEDLTIGEPGASAVRGRETVARSFVPGTGMVHEERVSVLGGKYMGRNTLTLAGPSNKAYQLVADPAMKGRLGRVRFVFPEGINAGNSAVAVYKGDEKVSGGYGASEFELMPGQYVAEVSKKRLPIEVKSGHNTIPTCGVLRIHAGSNTAYKVFDADQKTQLAGGYGNADVALPIGTYYVEIAGGREPVTLEDGKIVEF